MKNELSLNIFVVPQSSRSSLEWSSLQGDKYLGALPFQWSIVESLQDANVIVWDAMANQKAAEYVNKILTQLKSTQNVLLLQREAQSLKVLHPYIKKVDLSETQIVELAVGNTLPEDLLSALEMCYEKLKNV